MGNISIWWFHWFLHVAERMKFSSDFVVFLSAPKCLVCTKNSTNLNGESWYLLVTYGAIIGQQGKAKKSQFWGLSTMLNKPQKWTESRKVNKTPKTAPKRMGENGKPVCPHPFGHVTHTRTEIRTAGGKQERGGKRPHREVDNKPKIAKKMKFLVLNPKPNPQKKPYPQTLNPNPPNLSLNPKPYPKSLIPHPLNRN